MKTIDKCGAACLVWLKSCVFLKGKLGLFVGNPRIFLKFNTPVKFLNFLSN